MSVPATEGKAVVEFLLLGPLEVHDGDRPVVAQLDVVADATLLQRHAADRYRFHDPLRLCAAEHARRDPERDHARRRLCGSYLATADTGPHQFAWQLAEAAMRHSLTGLYARMRDPTTAMPQS